MKDLSPLRRALENWWQFIFKAWAERQTIGELCDVYNSLSAQDKEIHQLLHKANGERDLAIKEAEVISRDATEIRTELRELHVKYADLLRRKEAPEERAARDALYLANLEIDDLKQRLELERTGHEKTKRHIMTMWKFIALRNRIDLPAANGSIRKILQESEGRR